MGALQDDLFRLRPALDNPLRVSRAHPLVAQGIIRLTVAKDLAATRTISLANPSTYLGHCDGCPDVCGVALVGADAMAGSHERDSATTPARRRDHYHNPRARQMHLWLPNEERATKHATV